MQIIMLMVELQRLVYILLQELVKLIIMGDGQIKAKAVSENNGAEAFGIFDNTNNGNIQIEDVSMNISAEGNNSPSWAIGSVGYN